MTQPAVSISHISTNSQIHPKYRPDIDGLRAIAVLAVLAFHAFPEWIKGGFVGVDVFFVISGFLISSIIFKGLELEKFSFLDFYGRRIRRIFPALLLVLVAVLTFGWVALLSMEYKELGKHVIAGSGFVSNLVLWNESGYFDTAAESKPLLHLWSLGIEEQFYILWPFVLWAAWRKGFNLLSITVAVMLFSFLLNISNVSTDATATFYSPQTRFWELLIGSLLAWLVLYKGDSFAEQRLKLDEMLSRWVYAQPRQTSGEVLRNVLSVAGVGLIAYAVAVVTKDNFFPGWWAVLPTLGAALIICAGPDAWINRNILSSRVFVWFGLISFPLYLWHWPLLSYARIIEGDVPSYTIRSIAAVSSIALAWLTFKLIELPLRNRGSNRTKTIALVSMMVTVSAVGYATFTRDGFGFRLEKMGAIVNVFGNPMPTVDDFECSTRYEGLGALKFDGGCKLSKEADPELVFIGDSHAAHFRKALWTQFPNTPVMMIVQTSCLPFTGTDLQNPECQARQDAVLDFLKNNKSIKRVYLAGHWNYLMSGGFGTRGENWRIAKPVSNDSAKVFKENGVRFIKAVQQTGKEVVFVKDIPDLDFDIKSCYDTRPFRITEQSTAHIRKDCTLDYDYFMARTSAHRTIIAQLLAGLPAVKSYDPKPFLCRDGKCATNDETMPYYFNGDHLNWYGAGYVLKDLLIKTGGQLSSTTPNVSSN